MNELGLGLVFSAQNAASGVIQGVGRDLLHTVGAASEAGKAIKGYFKEFSIGMAIFGAGAAGLSMLAPAMKEASEFGKAIALVATESDLATFSVAKMKEVSFSLANDFGKLPKDEATAMYEAVGMGANTASKATALMTGANRLAVAGNADLKTTIDALGGAMRAYGASFTDTNANAYADTMFVAMTSGKTTVQELAGSLGRVTSMASSLGLSFEETTAAIAAMTSTGIEANMAVTGLHGAFANLLHPEQHATAEAARLGIKFDSVTLKTKGLMGMLQSITEAKGFKGVETMKKLFPSVEGFNAIMQITAGNMEGFKSAIGAMGDKAGAAAKGFAIMADQTSFQEDRMKSLKSTALILIGEALEPMTAGALKFANAFLEGFNKLPAPVANFLVKGFVLASTLAVIVGGAIAAKAAVGILAMGMSALGISFSSVLATVLPVVAAIGLVAVAFYAFRAAYDQNVGGFADFVDGVYGKVRLTFQALGQLFESGAFSGAVLDELDAGNQGVENFAIRVWGTFKRIEAFFGGLRDGFEKAIDAMKPALQEFSTSLEKFGVSFSSLYDQIDPKDASAKFDSFTNTGQGLGLTLGKIAEGLIKGATALVDFATAIKPIVGGLADLVVWVGSSDVAVTALKVGIVALASYMTATAIVATVEFGFAAANAAVRFALMATSMNIGGAAQGAVAAMRLVTSASATALGPVGALAAALTSLYLAFDQWSKLQKELGDSGWSDMWKKLKHDVGISSDAQYNRDRGVISPDDPGEYEAYQKKYGISSGSGLGPTQRKFDDAGFASFAPAGSRASQNELFTPAPAPAAVANAQAQAEAAGAMASPSDVAAAAVAAVSAQPPQVSTVVNAQLNCDGQVLGEICVKAVKAQSATGEAPMSLASY